MMLQGRILKPVRIPLFCARPKISEAFSTAAVALGLKRSSGSNPPEVKLNVRVIIS